MNISVLAMTEHCRHNTSLIKIDFSKKRSYKFTVVNNSLPVIILCVLISIARFPFDSLQYMLRVK